MSPDALRPLLRNGPSRRDNSALGRPAAIAIGDRDVSGLSLSTKVPVCSPHDSAATVLEMLRSSTFEWVEYVYLVDDRGRLDGVARLASILSLAENVPIASVAEKAVKAAYVDDSQEHVGNLVFHSGLDRLPVLDRNERLVGIVPPTLVVRILRQEHEEDLHRMAGIRRHLNLARSTIDSPPSRQALDRLPWLLTGLAGSVLATWIMTGFEAIIEARPEVAFFVPGLVYLADAVGTQTEAIAVRGISLSRLNVRELLLGELGAGLLTGCVLASVIVPLVYAAFPDPPLAASVGLAVLGGAIVASFVGLMLPWVISRFGKDPALGAGPLGTVIQDILSIVIYFVCLVLAFG